MEKAISPVPREARPYQGERAGLVTRLIAAVVDALTVFAGLVTTYAAVNLAAFVVHPRTFEFAGASILASVTTALVVGVVYLAVAWSITGRTYGDHVMGLRVVSGRGLRLRALRSLVRALLCVGFPVGLLWCATTSRRSLQDAVLRTSVIYDWRPRHHGPEALEPPLHTV
jgi:uncharacterized RDD family membrane protein YckC